MYSLKAVPFKRVSCFSDLILNATAMCIFSSKTTNQTRFYG